MSEVVSVRFKINESPVWSGRFVGMRSPEFAHVLCDEETMLAIGAFIVADGDKWEPEDRRDDGLYDLWDYAVKLVDPFEVLPVGTKEDASIIFDGMERAHEISKDVRDHVISAIGLGMLYAREWFKSSL